MHRSTASSLFLMALALILLASPLAAGKMKGWELLGERQVTDGLGSIDLMLDPDEVAARVLDLRVFRGYTGWGPEQLDDELAEGSWMVFGAELSDVFSTSPTNLWRAVLRRQGGRLAWVANAPDDLSAN